MGGADLCAVRDAKVRKRSDLWPREKGRSWAPFLWSPICCQYDIHGMGQALKARWNGTDANDVKP